MSNQDLINQLNADKIRLSGVTTQKQQQISNNQTNIDDYNSAINTLSDQITILQQEILDTETQITNDDLIIAYIPPDSDKK